MSKVAMIWTDRVATLEYVFAGRRIGVIAFPARVSRAAELSRLPPTMPDDAEAIAQLAGAGAVQLFSYPVLRRLPRIMVRLGAIRYVARHYDRFTVETTGTFDDYLSALSPKTRQTLKRKVRRFCAFAGCAEPWRRFATQDQLDEFYGLARQVSVVTYQERLLGVGLPSQSALVDLLREADGVRAFLLMNGKNAVAFLFTPLYGRTARYKFLGYDPAYSAWSPGTVLQYFALRSMFDDSDVEQLDFAEGPGQHKASFGTSRTLCADVYYFHINARSIAAIALHILVNAADRALVRALDWLHVKAKLRHLFRR